MHKDEVRATPDQVHQLLVSQCPQWANLPVVPLADGVEGTDHVLFRVGDDLVARMPKVAYAVEQAESDAKWLPLLGPFLPVKVPAPLYLGKPGSGFPWWWTVVPWMSGVTLPLHGCDQVRIAQELAAFARALHSLDASGGPRQQPGWRGAPLIHFDPHVRQVLPRLAEFDDGFDVAAAEAAWDICVAAPEWAEPPVWIHGDLQPGNLIIDDGHLAAVIDFGGLGVGDPAPDLAPALWTFTGAARAAYQGALGYDDATWLRACGWVLGPALTGIDYYRESFPQMAQFGRVTIGRVIAEFA